MFSRKRFVVTRLYLHLRGDGVAPVLGALNQAIQAEEDAMGTGLVDACNSLLDFEPYWYAAANEGEIFRDEGSTSAHFQELQTDADRYFATTLSVEVDAEDEDEPLTIPMTTNVVAIVTLAYTGEQAGLETELDDADVLATALKAAIDLHFQERLRGVQLHFMPARVGDELTEDRILEAFPDLVPL